MKPFHTGLSAAFALIGIALMTACSTMSQYDITVNEVTVYAPASPLRVDGIEDAAEDVEDEVEDATDDSPQ